MQMSARSILGKGPVTGSKSEDGSSAALSPAEHAGSGKRGLLEKMLASWRRAVRDAAMRSGLPSCDDWGSPGGLPGTSGISPKSKNLRIGCLAGPLGCWVARILDRARVLPAKCGTCHQYFTRDIVALCQFQRLCWFKSSVQPSGRFLPTTKPT